MWSAWDLRHLWTIYSRIWLPEPQPVLTGSYWPILMDLVDLMDHHDPCKLNLERQSLQALDCWRKCSVLLRTSWEVLQLQIEKGGGERAEQTVWTTFTTHCPSSCHCRLATNRWTIICSPGRHELRSFLAASSTQNYFLIARMLRFLWHSRQKCRI